MDIDHQTVGIWTNPSRWVTGVQNAKARHWFVIFSTPIPWFRVQLYHVAFWHPLFILFTAKIWWAKQYLPHLRNKPFEVSGTRHIFGMFHHHTVGIDTSGRSTSKQGDVPMTKPDKGFPPCLVGTVRQGLFSKLLSFFRDQFGWCLALS